MTIIKRYITLNKRIHLVTYILKQTSLSAYPNKYLMNSPHWNAPQRVASIAP